MNVIDKALEILETKGWCKGNFVNREGEHCMAGAIRCAISENDSIFILAPEQMAQYHEALCEMSRVIQANYTDERGFPRTGVADFNDDSRTKFEDVRSVMEKASLKLNERHELADA